MFPRTAHRPAMVGRRNDSDGLCALMLDWCGRYPIVSIEDPLAEDDAAGMQKFTAAIGVRVRVIGDDFWSPTRARWSRPPPMAPSMPCCSRSTRPGPSARLAALESAQRHGFGTVVSACSRETEDVAIAHLAVGWNARQLKVGLFAGSERMAKWNELVRIEEALGTQAQFAGTSGLAEGSSTLSTLTVCAAIITGGAQGIGYAAAGRLRALGTSVTLWGVNPAALADAPASLAGQGR
jgi:enolase